MDECESWCYFADDGCFRRRERVTRTWQRSCRIPSLPCSRQDALCCVHPLAWAVLVVGNKQTRHHTVRRSKKSAAMLSAVAARKQRAAASAVVSEDVPVPSTSAAAASSSSDSSSESSSDSSLDSDSGSDSDDSVSSEYMNTLLAAAKKNLSAKAQGKQRETDSEDVLMLGDDNDDKYVLSSLPCVCSDLHSPKDLCRA